MQNISNFTSLEPINVNDKRVINATTDINQLAPFKYQWAWDFFLKANNNHWTPNEINMSNDLADYTTKLTPQEKHLYENVLAYLTTADILAMRNIENEIFIESFKELKQLIKIFDQIIFNPGITIANIVKNLRIDRKKVNQYIFMLDECGLVKMKTAKKSPYKLYAKDYE